MCYTQSEQAEVSALREELTGALIGLARATEGNEHMLSGSTAAVTVEGLMATAPEGNPTTDGLRSLLERVDGEKRKLVPSCYICAAPCGRTENYDMQRLWNGDQDTRALKALILLGIRGIAACVYRAAALGCREEAIHAFLYKALFAVGMEDWGREELLPILLEMGEVNLASMALLDKGRRKTG